jgi:hypothetical protein
MATPDPEGVSLLAKVLGAATAVVVPIWGARTWLDRKFEKKADKHQVNNQFQEVKFDITQVKQTQAKIFDQMTASERIAEARHRELMMHMLGNKK